MNRFAYPAALALTVLALTGCTGVNNVPGAANANNGSTESASATETANEAWVPSHRTPAAGSLLTEATDDKTWANTTDITQTSEGDSVYIWRADPAASTNNNQVVLIFPAPEKCHGEGDSVQQAMFDLPDVASIYKKVVPKYGNSTTNQEATASGNVESATVNPDTATPIHQILEHRINEQYAGTDMELHANAYQGADGKTVVGSCAVVYGDILDGTQTSTYNQALAEARDLASTTTLTKP